MGVASGALFSLNSACGQSFTFVFFSQEKYEGFLQQVKLYLENFPLVELPVKTFAELREYLQNDHSYAYVNPLLSIVMNNHPAGDDMLLKIKEEYAMGRMESP